MNQVSRSHRTTSTRSQDVDKISILTKPFFPLLLPQSLSPLSVLPSLSLSHTHPQNYKKKTQNLRNPQTETNKQKHISMTKPFSFFHSYPNNLLNTSLPHTQQQKGEKGWHPQQQQQQQEGEEE
jgi:hypothetical protein